MVSVINACNGLQFKSTVIKPTQATVTAVTQTPAMNITKVASPSSYDHIGKLSHTPIL